MNQLIDGRMDEVDLSVVNALFIVSKKAKLLQFILMIVAFIIMLLSVCVSCCNSIRHAQY